MCAVFLITQAINSSRERGSFLHNLKVSCVFLLEIYSSCSSFLKKLICVAYILRLKTFSKISFSGIFPKSRGFTERMRPEGKTKKKWRNVRMEDRRWCQGKTAVRWAFKGNLKRLADVLDLSIQKDLCGLKHTALTYLKRSDCHSECFPLFLIRLKTRRSTLLPHLSSSFPQCLNVSQLQPIFSPENKSKG